ncbi:YqjF family protein [Oceanobacillus massiliensis]|uniref:YqjF family protein n=1 Tax=Oceanobacillus massiliensis TaxID=1465765 RepID=UPI0002895AF8|nr:DUF2071 domain-containing protein [Oceanobacillus massiliensis]
MYKDILNRIEHRDHPLPAGPWLMTQRWDHLLFMHLPVSKNIMKSLIPEGLELDTYNDKAWITIIPFKVNNMRLRKVPPVPFMNSYLELNVRTYVIKNGLPGIYFFSLDANMLSAVLGARVGTIPYFYAKMSMKRMGSTYHYNSRRRGSSKAVFKGSYRPLSAPAQPKKHSLSYWLLERYFMWSHRGKQLYRVGIHHLQWEVMDVEVTIEKQEMMPFLPAEAVIGNPIFHYAHSKRVLFWPIKKED